jgi:hypothetical protein
VGDLKPTEDEIQTLHGNISMECKLGLATVAVVALAKDLVDHGRKDMTSRASYILSTRVRIHRVLMATALRPASTLNNFHPKD